MLRKGMGYVYLVFFPVNFVNGKRIFGIDWLTEDIRQIAIDAYFLFQH